MSYLTENEVIQQVQTFLLELEQGLIKGNYKNEIEEIPFAVVISNPEKVELGYINKAYEELTGRSKHEINKSSSKHLEEIVHPTSLKNVKRFLPIFYLQQSAHKTMYFVQYAKLEGKEKYSPLITFTKVPHSKNKSVVRLLLKVSEFADLSTEMAQIVKIDQFKLKHFQKFQQLSGREVEVLSLIANGYNNPQIAEELYLARQTIETHRKNIKYKLEIKNLRDLMKYAFAFNLIEI